MLIGAQSPTGVRTRKPPTLNKAPFKDSVFITSESCSTPSLFLAVTCLNCLQIILRLGGGAQGVTERKEKPGFTSGSTVEFLSRPLSKPSFPGKPPARAKVKGVTLDFPLA